MGYLARFKHDFQWTTDWIRPGRLTSYPETVPLFVAPREGAGKDDVRLPPTWTAYVQTINPDRGKYILTPAAGWLNSNESADSLGFGGNLVGILDDVDKDWAHVASFNAGNAPPDPRLVNYQSGDPRIQKFTAITKGGQIRNAGSGLDVYSVILARGELYVPRYRIEKFPDLPMTVLIDQTALRGETLRVRSAPDASTSIVQGLLSESVDILEYAPRGSNVWGRIPEGWIALLFEGKYFTSWRMETTPPLAARGSVNVLESKAAFEKWAMPKGLSLRPKSPTEYADASTQAFWECWQAARRS